MYFSFFGPAVFVCIPLSLGMSMSIFLNAVIVTPFVYDNFIVYIIVVFRLNMFYVGWTCF